MGIEALPKRHHFNHLLSNRALSAASVLTVLYLTLLRLVAGFSLLSEFLLSLWQICINAKLDNFMLIT